MGTRLIEGANPNAPASRYSLHLAHLGKPLKVHLQSFGKFYLLKLKQSSAQGAAEAEASLSSWWHFLVFMQRSISLFNTIKN